ncbi:hypothetical protein KSP39_PZI012051 [Platanthera zijinensis]|uniref:Prolamin-like domain-containing protein n=1 Tax=Platanthera zijinensis TaxID=2320716 RepID=A0AAP0G4L3_9ASPA
MAANGASLPLTILLLAAILAAAAATTHHSYAADKEEHAIVPQSHENFEAYVNDCVHAITTIDYDCMRMVVKGIFFTKVYLDMKCCQLFFVQIGTQCVLEALRFIYPFKTGLTKDLQFYCDNLHKDDHLHNGYIPPPQWAGALEDKNERLFLN